MVEFNSKRVCFDGSRRLNSRGQCFDLIFDAKLENAGSVCDVSGCFPKSLPILSVTCSVVEFAVESFCVADPFLLCGARPAALFLCVNRSRGQG